MDSLTLKRHNRKYVKIIEKPHTAQSFEIR